MVFQIFLIIISMAAGAIASIAGFGIGSILTPFVSLKISISVAIAAVSIAHFSGTLTRYLSLRKHINKKVLLSFGLMSALGGLTGALLHSFLHSSTLTFFFGVLLVLSGVSGLSGFSERVKFKGSIVWFLGFLSGLFGGLVGNQGGIRSSALLNFKLKKREFVATATAVALVVDAARVPVYLVIYKTELLNNWFVIFFITAGVLTGTFYGTKILGRINESIFKKFVSFVIFLLGIYILIHG